MARVWLLAVGMFLAGITTALAVSAPLPDEVRTALEQGDRATAMARLHAHVASLSADDPAQRVVLIDALAALADLAQRIGDLQARQDALRQLVALTADDAATTARWRLEIGYTRLQLGDETGALAAFRENLDGDGASVALDPAVNMQSRLGVIQVLVNRFERTAAQAELQAATQELQRLKQHPSARAWLGSLLQLRGELAFRAARTHQALTDYEKAYALRVKVHGEQSPEATQSLLAMASAYKGLHDFMQAEELYRRALANYEALLGFEHPYVATVLSNMGQMYYLQGRFTESERVLLKSLAIKQAAFGEGHLSLAETYNHLGYLYFLLERYSEATAAIEHALHIWRRPETARPRYAASAETWLAVIESRNGRLDQALERMDRVISALVTIFGEETVATSDALREQAEMLAAAGRDMEAEQSYRDAVRSAGRLGDGDWIGEIHARSAYAAYLLTGGRHEEALATARGAISGLELRLERQAGLRADVLDSELQTLREATLVHVDVLYELLQKGGDASPRRTWLEESFITAQLARSSSAARALQHFVARFAAGTGATSELLRQRQDTVRSWREIDDALRSALQKPAAERDMGVETRLREESARLRERLAEIDRQLELSDVDVARLIRPAPVSLDTLQGLLQDQEALILYLFGETRGYQWVVTAADVRLIRLDVGRQQLERQVRRLRRKLAPRYAGGNVLPTPFPLAQAWRLHDTVMNAATASLEPGTHLLIVADGPLQSLPLSLLLTESPDRADPGGNYATRPWLISRHPITALPAVKSLALLRERAATSVPGRQAFIGFGDPRLADAAAPMGGQMGAESSGLRSLLGTLRSTVPSDVLQTLPELPDTADELRRISGLLGQDRSAVYLRDDATERQAQALPLASYEVLQFATHGLMAGDFQGLFEPALVMTPEAGLADGLLTASEVTALELDADLVVLSACNTAANDGTPGAEGLSGLAQAFFYAGSRALLVTHWEVASDAAVRMTTRLFEDAVQPRSLAQAHQAATLSLMRDHEGPDYTHPMFWAPFMLVGDTARRVPGS